MKSSRQQPNPKNFPPRLEKVSISRAQMEHTLLGQTRRKFLASATGSLGSLALSCLLERQAAFAAPKAQTSPQNLQRLAPRAKRVIHLCMAGGPSQFETLDPKPIMTRRDGQPMPESLTQGQPIAQLQGQALKIMGPRAGFSRCGTSGVEVADTFPHIQKVADELCIVRSMMTEQSTMIPHICTSIQGLVCLATLVWGHGFCMD